jgi:hypothetical protein
MNPKEKAMDLMDTTDKEVMKRTITEELNQQEFITLALDNTNDKAFLDNHKIYTY